MLTVGATVHWESQASGFWKVKVGEIVAFVPAGRHLQPYLPAEAHGKDLRLIGVQLSTYDRYLVRVTRKDGRHDYYAPRASVVKEGEPSANTGGPDTKRYQW